METEPDQQDPFLRDGPILPENHPMVPWPVRMGLKEMRHKKEIEALQKQLTDKERPPVVGKVLWYAFWSWTVFVTLAYFGILDGARPYINALLESFREFSALVHP